MWYSTFRRKKIEHIHIQFFYLSENLTSPEIFFFLLCVYLINFEKWNQICKQYFHYQHQTMALKNGAFLISRFYSKSLDPLSEWRCCHSSLGSEIGISFWKKSFESRFLDEPWRFSGCFTLCASTMNLWEDSVSVYCFSASNPCVSHRKALERCFLTKGINTHKKTRNKRHCMWSWLFL